MEITETVEPVTRAAWRAWLAEHHARRSEIWLLYGTGKAARPGELTYLDAVEEAMCVGWIDGIAKKQGALTAQRFTPRRARSHWTELNKERARRLIACGRMTEAGRKVLPDLDASVFTLPPDLERRLREDPEVWRHFEGFPDLYRRVRVSYIEEMRNRSGDEYEKRLRNFLDRTRKGEMFGNWDDTGLPRTEDL